MTRIIARISAAAAVRLGTKMRAIHRFAALALGAGLMAACSRAPDQTDAPLAFVPADTAYVYANIDALPTAVTDQWSVRMHEYWPAVFGIYDQLLQQADANGDAHSQRWIKVARTLIEEIQEHDSLEKLRQIGFKPDAHVAFYGVGMVPVVRLELGDPAAFKAEVARIEGKIGEKVPLGKTGAQEYWQVGNDKLAAVVAIEGTHLVATLLPPNASDTLRQSLLGLVRPAQNLAAAGTLQTLAKQYNYSPFGEGYIDFVRLTDRLSSAPTGTDAEFAKAMDLPAHATDAICHGEFLELAHKFPRLVMGAEELGVQHMRIGAQLEIEPVLAQQFASAIGPAPGTAASGEGVIDVSIALPVLKLKDFWIKRADAVADKPFACSSLAKLNDGSREAKQKMDVTVPPPFSDAVGVRFTLDRFSLDSAGKMPDVAGKLLFASTNPQAALAMAQLAVPALAKVKIAADGKPVALPAGITPTLPTPPLFVAMSNQAIALAVGADEAALLGAYLRAPAANDAVFLRLYFSSKFYALLAQSFDKLQAAMPADKQAHFAQQKKMFELYEKWLKSGEITLVATPTGIALHEIIEQN
jgi:hypothetical protein